MSAKDILGLTGSEKVGSENVLLLLISLKISKSILVLFYTLVVVSIVELECAILKVLLGLKKRRD